MSKILRLGYIGSGRSTHRYHAPFVLTRENFKIAKIYSPNGLSELRWTKIEGAVYTDDLEDILNDPEIDVICVCCLTQHYEYAKMALEHNKHVLVEKAFVDTLDQAKELFAMAKEKNLLVQCYQNRRFDSDYLTVKELLDSGVLGDLVEVDMAYDYYRPEEPAYLSEVKKANQLPLVANMIYGHGSHTLDQAIALFGFPDHVHYDVRALTGEDHMNDYFDIDLYYKNVKVSVKFSYNRLVKRPIFAIYGQKGVYIKENVNVQEEQLQMFYLPGNPDFGVEKLEQYGTLTYIDDNKVIHQEKYPTVTGDYGKVYDALYDSVVNGKPKLVKDEETLEVMRLIEEGYKELRYIY